MFDFLKTGGIELEDVERTIKELSLPDKIKALAIYKRYKEIKKIETQMNKSVRQLQKKYLKLDAPVIAKASEIISGKRSISAEELKDLPTYLNQEEIKQVNNHLGPKKIQGYWWKCFNTSGVIKESLGKEDQGLLRCLEDITVIDEQNTDNFTINFDFSQNEIIKNKQLSVRFVLKDERPVKSQSTVIEWVGKNLTMKQIKKKQKNKKTGQQRVVTKQVKAKSFFNFFTSIDVSHINANPMEANQQDAKVSEQLENTFEIAGVLVDQIQPYSLQYYLGITHEGDQDYGENEQEDDEDDDGSGEQGNKKKKNKKQKDSKSKSKSKSKGKDNKPKTEQKPQCKQQ